MEFRSAIANAVSSFYYNRKRVLALSAFWEKERRTFNCVNSRCMSRHVLLKHYIMTLRRVNNNVNVEWTTLTRCTNFYYEQNGLSLHRACTISYPAHIHVIYILCFFYKYLYSHALSFLPCNLTVPQCFFYYEFLK